ncbi:outer membrane lipoprotein carrier protein LolA [Thermodesulfobacteriota bacterium]
MKLKKILFSFLFFSIILMPSAKAPGKDSNPPGKTSNLTLDQILKKIEKKYALSGFSARFFQSSTIKVMDITDTASGRLLIKHPGMMRWEYEVPDRQIIISDGFQLWIYRPDDNQVMIGKAPAFFGDGKGASFLSDITRMRENFTISKETSGRAEHHILKLVPRNKSFDLSVIYLTISSDTSDVVQIVTYNSYDDETRIKLSDIRFNPDLDNSLFKFTTPEGAEILQLGEQP